MKTDIIQIDGLKWLYREIANSCACLSKTVVSKMAFGHKLHLCSFLSQKIVYILLEDNLTQTQTQLAQYGLKTLVLQPVYEVLLHRHTANLTAIGNRIKNLKEIVSGDYDVLLVTPRVLVQYLPDRKTFEKSFLELVTGEEYDQDEIVDSLGRMGYKKQPLADEKGTFSVLGDVLDVYSVDSDLPTRILFDFDQITSIKKFNPDTMQGNVKLDRFTILPATDMLYDANPDEIIEAIRKSRRLQSAKASARTGEIVSDVELKLYSNPHDPALNWIIPFITDKLSTFFDYLPDDVLIVTDEPQDVFQYLDLTIKVHKERVISLTKDGEVLPNHGNSILTMERVAKELSKFHQLGFSALNLSGISDINGGSFLGNSDGLPSYFKDTALLVKDIAEYLSRGYAVKIFCGNQNNIDLMKSFLGELDVDYSSKPLNRGFVYPPAKIMVIGMQDLCLTSTAVTKTQIKRRTVAPKAGDYVVHEDYGVGRCLGIKHQKSYVGEKDYLVLEYAKGAKVYVPVQQMDVLELYAGGESAPKLSDIDKGDFEKQKSKARASIKKLAFDLLELYAKREESAGYIYPPDSTLMKEFEASFEFEETPDQIKAIAEIKKDMEKGKVMDRLICGDVGFGKTEVALRAIFKTVCENKQVAVLAPTTILAEQHFMTMVERLQPFGVRVACLTRFRSPVQVKSILKELALGTINVVIGTHRLLSKDVSFFDLGLLVLDEEQRFGVEDKERIKTFRNNVNVLSMSATPIPRTLHMALSGIRDVSVLDTPPKGRKPVETIVAEYSDATLVDAVNNELNRGGQVFILYNSIEKIYPFYTKLRNLLPDVRVVLGHGQMASKELEENIYRFYAKEADVLLSTTIIENGIDIPNANTLFVLEANRLGLSQMYQLKGRVGRSTRSATAYFTYPEGYAPTGDVEKRFNALMENTDLGSGYNLALRDLEIRGAGSVLGREQHGHVEKIGYDMYCRLLRETIALMKGETVSTYTMCEVNASLDAYLPEDLIKGERERLKIYKRIADFEKPSDRTDFEKDFVELYGSLPTPVKNLARVSLVRVLASKCGVVKAEIDPRYLRLKFITDDYLKSTAFLQALQTVKHPVYPVITSKQVEFMLLRCGVEEKMEFLINFLCYANGNYDLF